MVDSIGIRLVTTDRGAARVTAATPVAAPRRTADALVAQTGGLAHSLAASPPIDLQRVERIKAAIADRTYPILPDSIADNMIALQRKLIGAGRN